MTAYDVMQLAGHREFSTTHRFYLAVRSDLIDRARRGHKRSHGREFCDAFGTRLNFWMKGVDCGGRKWLQWQDLQLSRP